MQTWENGPSGGTESILFRGRKDKMDILVKQLLTAIHSVGCTPLKRMEGEVVQYEVRDKASRQ